MKSKLICSEKITIFSKTQPIIKKVRDGKTYTFTDIIAFNTEKEINLRTTQNIVKQKINENKSLRYKMEDK
uniref:Uncharacterized protein n=1 Tax=viral metagenome TaxID=1070528 RepID=A0A6M3IJN5_9ZZZZ